MRLLIFWAVLPLLPVGFPQTAWADRFAGIEPGQSSKEEVRRVLGDPVAASSLGDRVEYRGAPFDAAKIVVHYRLSDAVAEKIEVYPVVRAGRDDHREWFSLEGPAEVSTDSDGSRLEVYPARGMALKFGLAAEADQVITIVHFPLPGRPAVRPAAVMTPLPQPAGQKYFGVEIQNDHGGVLVRDVHPGSPAERFGLAAGDRILGSGRTRFTSTADLVALIERYPVREPMPFLIQRGGKVFELRIPPELKSPAEVRAIGERYRQARLAQEQAAQAEAQKRRQATAESVSKLVGLINEQLIQPIES
ncbi:MAG: PDZ domain-containing protein [Candidatus Omnitrophica bacterium]|nr:PDZ domain-containing protein [Candidatus Omnitrophota bacterium]